MDEIKLSEWWAVQTNGSWFCGRRTGDKLTNVQGLTLQLTVEPTPKGPFSR